MKVDKDEAFIKILYQLLDRDRNSKLKLIVHKGKIIKLDLDLVSFIFEISDEGNVCRAAKHEKEDVCIKIPFSSYPKILVGINEVRKDIEIFGNAEIASVFASAITSLDWNYEQDLSRIFGVILANRIVLLIEILKENFRNSSNSVIRSSKEFLVDEKRILISNDENYFFNDEILKFRDRVEHLDVRIVSLIKEIDK